MKTNNGLQNNIEKTHKKKPHHKVDDNSFLHQNKSVNLGNTEETFTPTIKVEPIAEKRRGVTEIIKKICITKNSLLSYTKSGINFELARILVAGDHKVGISIEGNRVTLSGNVGSQIQKDNVARIARSTPGIINVTNNIQVI